MHLSKTRWERYIKESSIVKECESKVLVDLDKIKRNFALHWPFFVTPMIRLSEFSQVPTTISMLRNSMKSGLILDLATGNEEYISNFRLQRGRRMKKGYGRSNNPNDFDMFTHLQFPGSRSEFRKLRFPIVVSSVYEIREMVSVTRYSSPLRFILHLDWNCESMLWKLNFEELFQFIKVHRVVGVYISSNVNPSSPVSTCIPYTNHQHQKRRKKRGRKQGRVTVGKLEKVLHELSRIIDTISNDAEYDRSEDFRTLILGHPFSTDFLSTHPPNSTSSSSSDDKKRVKQKKSKIEEIIQKFTNPPSVQNNNNSNRTDFSSQRRRRRRRRRRVMRSLKVFGEVGSRFVSDCFCCVSPVIGIRTSYFPYDMMFNFKPDWFSSDDDDDGYNDDDENGYTERTARRRTYFSYQVDEGVCANIQLFPRSNKSTFKFLRDRSRGEGDEGDVYHPMAGSLRVEKYNCVSSCSNNTHKKNKKKKNKKLYVADVVGPSGNVDDVLCKFVKLPRLKKGDLLYFPEFGSSFIGKNRKSVVGHKKLEVVHFLDGERIEGLM